MNGVLCINKPEDFTSFDVIAKLRGILRIKRLGHAGTLDPMATGVLPVFVGKATRACDIIPNNEKSYRASFKLGVVTDTQDITGKVISEMEFDVENLKLVEAISQFKGEIMQIPPMYSAVSVGGKRLYDLARKGIEVERKARKITIDDICLENYDRAEGTGTLTIKCVKGTYIRTIIHDIGQVLSCGAIMTSLVRTSSSGFTLEDCYSFDDVVKMRDEGTLTDALIPIDRLFESYSEIRLDEKQSQLYQNGVRLDLARLSVADSEELHRVYSASGEFIGIGESDFESMELKVRKNF